ncbi:MAG: twin-arginine translocation signal domain-containing protein [Rhodospirillales bacterium]|nr:twin-arginine translocation signal domain-containing protein [Rhodospirillales bacterium]
MKKTEKSDSLARRDFLKGAGVAGVAGIATAALSGNEAQAALPEDRKTSGYRETEHVMKYYELSRF